MNVAETLKRTIIDLPLANQTKLFIFGITGKDVCRIKKRKLSIGPRLKARIYDKIRNTDYSAIEDKLREWTADSSNIAADLRMEDLAKRIDVKPYTLMKYFEVCLKKDFRVWRTGMRIEYAKRLLLKDNDSDIGKIARAVGFHDKSNFHRQFKNYTGCTPSMWRKTSGHPDVG